MVSGFDRYFQLARCFRDEDLRNDRQPEFTQIDLEASFVGMEDVLGYVEAVLVALWDEAGHTIARPFPRINWREAMERYGTDKPDLRFEVAIADWTAQVKPLGVPFFQSALKDGARVRGLAVKGGGGLSRKDVDQLAEAAKQLGSSGLAWVKRQGEQISGSVGKHFTAETLGQLGVADGDAALMAVGPDRVTSPVLDRVRQEVIRRLDFKPKAAHAFCWVVDFPLFEPDRRRGDPCSRITRSPRRTRMTWRGSTRIRSAAARCITTRSTTATSWAPDRSGSPTPRCSAACSVTWACRPRTPRPGSGSC